MRFKQHVMTLVRSGHRKLDLVPRGRALRGACGKVNAVLWRRRCSSSDTTSIRHRGATSSVPLTGKWLGRYLFVVAIILAVPSMAGAAETDVREFLDRAKSVFHTPPVRLVTLRSDRGQPYYRAGKIYLPPWVYESPFRLEIAAHEFGHHLQGPPALRRFAVMRSVREAEQYQREMDANVLAVEVVRRLDGISELDAVIRVHGLLATMAATEMREYPTRRFGHKDRCVEAADLLTHFPRYRADLMPRCPAEVSLR
jgi:hypothetical protein